MNVKTQSAEDYLRDSIYNLLDEIERLDPIECGARTWMSLSYAKI
jgi:hypothetical protein